MDVNKFKIGLLEIFIWSFKQKSGLDLKDFIISSASYIYLIWECFQRWCINLTSESLMNLWLFSFKWIAKLELSVLLLYARICSFNLWFSDLPDFPVYLAGQSLQFSSYTPLFWKWSILSLGEDKYEDRVFSILNAELRMNV